MRRFRFLVLTVALFLLVFSWVPAALAQDAVPAVPVGGQQTSSLPPDTIVSSDGQVFSAEGAAEDGSLFSPSFAGTGVTSGPSMVVNDKQIPWLRSTAPGSVIGADGRTQVTATTLSPSRAIAFLKITFPTGSGTCTGWFIGPRTVMTAGHCVYDANSDKWATSIRVYPGRNGSSQPYGSSTAHQLFSVVGWTSSHDLHYDYGAIQLNSGLGNTVGWFGFRYQSGDTFSGRYTVRGYPGDKPYATMWTMSQDPGIRRVETYRLFYAMDTYGGQSGSPVYHNYSTSCNPCGVAIHAYGVGADPNGQYNSGTRIRKAVFDNMKAWKNYAYP